MEDLAKEGVTYAEIRFAPQLSVSGGLTQDQVVEAAIRGAERGWKEIFAILPQVCYDDGRYGKI